MLPYDYTRCISEECPSKDKCLRYTDWPKDVLLSFSELFSSGRMDTSGQCVYFIKDNQNVVD